MVTLAPAACASRPVIVSAWSFQASGQLLAAARSGQGRTVAAVPRRIMLCAQAGPPPPTRAADPASACGVTVIVRYPSPAGSAAAIHGILRRGAARTAATSTGVRPFGRAISDRESG